MNAYLRFWPEQRGASVAVGKRPPPNPARGDLWWDGQLYVYTGHAWVPASCDSCRDEGNVIVSHKPPPPQLGRLWFSLADLKLYVAAGSPLQWIAASCCDPPVDVGPEPPMSPAQGALWWDTLVGKMFVFVIDATSAQWVEVPGGAPGP